MKNHDKFVILNINRLLCVAFNLIEKYDCLKTILT